MSAASVTSDAMIQAARFIVLSRGPRDTPPACRRFETVSGFTREVSAEPHHEVFRQALRHSLLDQPAGLCLGNPCGLVVADRTGIDDQDFNATIQSASIRRLVGCNRPLATESVPGQSRQLDPADLVQELRDVLGALL